MNEQLNLFNTEEEFNFEEMKQKLIDNLDKLKDMSVQEQTLYKLAGDEQRREDE